MTPDHLMSYTLGVLNTEVSTVFSTIIRGWINGRPREERPLGDDAAGFGRERDEYLPAAIE